MLWRQAGVHSSSCQKYYTASVQSLQLSVILRTDYLVGSVCIPSDTREKLQPKIYRIIQVRGRRDISFCRICSQSAEKIDVTYESTPKLSLK